MPVLIIHPGPLPNEAQCAHVETKIGQRGAAWARSYMAKIAPWEQWPIGIQSLVERYEREEAQGERLA